MSLTKRPKRPMVNRPAPAGYSDHEFFRPRDLAEDDAFNNGRSYNGVPNWDLPNTCECGAAFHDHHNGRCPL